MGGLQKEFDEVDIVVLVPEILFKQKVNGSLEEECIVDGDHADTVGAIVTWLAAARNGGVHDVVRDEEEGL